MDMEENRSECFVLHQMFEWQIDDIKRPTKKAKRKKLGAKFLISSFALYLLRHHHMVDLSSNCQIRHWKRGLEKTIFLKLIFIS